MKVQYDHHDRIALIDVMCRSALMYEIQTWSVVTLDFLIFQVFGYAISIYINRGFTEATNKFPTV